MAEQDGNAGVFMLNVFRPWSSDIGAVDQTMTMIYRAAESVWRTRRHSESNVGNTTTPAEVLRARKIRCHAEESPGGHAGCTERGGGKVMQNTDLPVFLFICS